MSRAAVLAFACLSFLAGAGLVGAGLACAQPPAADAHGAPDEDPEAEAGRALLVKHGCVGCHSLDGRPGAGPTFADRWGGLASVEVDGVARPVPYDRAYLARAVAAPDAEIAAGWSAGVMPAYDLEPAALDRMAAALAAVATAAPEPPPSDWRPLLAGALLFVLGHFLLSSGPIRDRLVGRLGEVGFQIGYSVVAALGLTLMAIGLDAAPYVPLWTPAPWTATVPLAVMPVAFLLWVFGFSTPSPTAAGQAQRAEREDAARGVLAITRHPALWGFALWALAHVVANGDLATTVFFGAFAVLAFGGMWHIDRRRARRLGDDWRRFASQTSAVPFAALLSGRARLRFGRGDLLRLAVAAILFFGFLHTHHLLFGVPAIRG